MGQSPAAVATDPGEAFVEVAAAEIGHDRPLDNRPPIAVLRLEPLVVDLLERVEVAVHQAPQVGGLGIAGPVQGQRVDAVGGHDQKRSQPRIVDDIAENPIKAGLSEGEYILCGSQ